MATVGSDFSEKLYGTGDEILVTLNKDQTTLNLCNIISSFAHFDYYMYEIFHLSLTSFF